MSRPLDRLVREARRDLGVREARGVDWDKVDRGLFVRIEEERRAEAARQSRGQSPVWRIGAVALAAAAAFAIVVGKTREPRTLDAPSAAVAASAGEVVAITQPGSLQIGGKPAAVGATVHLGDVLEASGGAVRIERRGKVTLELEAGSKATVTHVQGALVLALERGAVEAQVVPVAAGEAFAVDVDGERVAVHGTHLRVARDGLRDLTFVDLNEGVVVVGPAPRVGSTVGTLVTAPAHAEFAPRDPASLVVTHEASSVRAPVALGSAQAGPVDGPPPVSPTTVSRPVEPRNPPLPAAPGSRPAPAASGAAPAAATPDPAAPATLAAAVRACMAAHRSSENVTVVVSTNLHLDLDPSGNVRAARFDPPVAADVNACAAQTIYKTRFSHDGAADVRVDFTAPASAP